MEYFDLSDNLKVFVSSTQGKDLDDERNRVIKYIRDSKYNSLNFESFGARPTGSMETIFERIRRSDIVIFILGETYSIPVKKEFDNAKSFRKECLIFAKNVPERNDDLEKFLKRLKANENVTIAYFNNSDDLLEHIKYSLANLLSKKFKNFQELEDMISNFYNRGKFNWKKFKPTHETDEYYFDIK